MSTKIRTIPNYESGRFYYVGSGGRVMSRAPRDKKSAREEDMAPIVRQPKTLYYVKDGVLYSSPMKKR